MVSQPTFTKRAAMRIAFLEAECLRSAPPGKYLSFIGWKNEVETGSPPGPLLAQHYVSDAAGVPEERIVEFHGVRLAFNVHDRLLAQLRSPVLDFDGERFVFVETDKADRG